MNLTEVLDEIQKNSLMAQLSVGSQDVINGYGWHATYHIAIYEKIEFCVRCRDKLNLDYSEDAHPFGNHQWETEDRRIYNNQYYDVNTMCQDILKFIKEWKEIKQ